MRTTSRRGDVARRPALALHLPGCGRRGLPAAGRGCGAGAGLSDARFRRAALSPAFGSRGARPNRQRHKPKGGAGASRRGPAHRPVPRWSLQTPDRSRGGGPAREAIAAAPGEVGALDGPGSRRPGAGGTDSDRDRPRCALGHARRPPVGPGLLGLSCGAVRAPGDEQVLRPLAALYALRGMDDADAPSRLAWMLPAETQSYS